MVLTKSKRTAGRGPSLIYIVAILVIIAIAGARFFGFSPAVRDKAQHDGMMNDQPDLPPSASDALSHPQVLVYHTHTTENYKGKEPHEKRGPGEVAAVGKTFVDALRREGFGAIHVMTVHDLPDWNGSVERAGRSLEQALHRSESIDVILDVHRDAIPTGEEPGYARVTKDDQTYARILLVVGSSDNPKVEANLAFAQQLRDELEARVPGITRGVRMLQQQANGHMKEKSVTLFIGDHQDNAIEEAHASAHVLAQATAALLQAE